MVKIDEIAIVGLTTTAYTFGVLDKKTTILVIMVIGLYLAYRRLY